MSSEAAAAKEAKPNKGGRPRKDLTKTPEFQAAVSKAVEDASAKIAAQFAAQMAALGSASNSTHDESWIAKLAIAMTEVTHAGLPQSRRPLSPEVVQKRNEARDRLVELIARGHAQGWPARPQYRIISKVYLDEMVVEPFRTDPGTKKIIATEVEWCGIPNEAMSPVNPVAQEIFTAFMDSIGGSTVIARTHDGRSFVGDNRGMSVTPGGLVVKGLGASARREVSGLGDSNVPAGSRITTAADPTATHVRVLGTLHPPAQQNYQEPGAR